MDAPTSSTRMATDAERRFKQMVTAEYTFIWRALRGLGVPSASVDDAAQQVFLVAAQKFDVVTPGSERAFLFATARGVAANARRAAAPHRQAGGEDELATKADDAPDPEQLASKSRAREILMRILDAMSEDLRTAFVLHELEGLTMAAIAELLDVPPGTVASRIRRAREQFEAATRPYHASEQTTGGGR